MYICMCCFFRGESEVYVGERHSAKSSEIAIGETVAR